MPRRWILPPWQMYLMVVVLALAAYLPTLKVGFLWDDHTIIANNPYIRSWTWDNLKHDFVADNTQGTGDDYYRPLQAISHRIDYSLYGLNPLGYHLSVVLVHIANGILLFHLVLLLGFMPLTALVAAVLFAVSPVGVEQFIIPSGRTTPLSFFFSLSCIVLLLHRTLWASVLGVVCFVLALLIKETSVIAPVLVALVFYYRKEPAKRWGWVAALLLLIPPYLLLRHNAVQSTVGPIDPDLFVLFSTKVFARILWHYVCLILWPWNLHSHHLIPSLSRVWFLFTGGALAIIGALFWKRHRFGLFCAGWFAAWLLPTIPVMMSGGFMLDHWAYPMTLGVLLPVALGIARGWDSGQRTLRTASGTLFFAMIIGGALLVHLNVELRGTDEKMYRWALYFTESSPIKHNLGALLVETGRPREAFPYLEDVRALYPEDPRNTRALAIAYWEAGYRPLAIRQLEDYLRRYPSHPDVEETLKKMRSRR